MPGGPGLKGFGLWVVVPGRLGVRGCVLGVACGAPTLHAPFGTINSTVPVILVQSARVVGIINVALQFTYSYTVVVQLY